MRGKGSPCAAPLWCTRITPAYAGKSPTAAMAQRPQRDHPRVCGEKLHENFHVILDDGITPAYAGKSPLYHNLQTMC